MTFLPTLTWGLPLPMVRLSARAAVLLKEISVPGGIGRRCQKGPYEPMENYDVCCLTQRSIIFHRGRVNDKTDYP